MAEMWPRGPTFDQMASPRVWANGFTQSRPAPTTASRRPRQPRLLVPLACRPRRKNLHRRALDGVTTHRRSRGHRHAGQQSVDRQSRSLLDHGAGRAPNASSDPKSIARPSPSSPSAGGLVRTGPLRSAGSDGGHVLKPIGIVLGGLLLKNSYPHRSTTVPNLLENGQQVVQIVPKSAWPPTLQN